MPPELSCLTEGSLIVLNNMGVDIEGISDFLNVELRFAFENQIEFSHFFGVHYGDAGCAVHLFLYALLEHFLDGGFGFVHLAK
mgnify:CR=1 FL=1